MATVSLYITQDTKRSAAAAAPTLTSLVLSGVHCSSCTRTVEKALLSLPGVYSAIADPVLLSCVVQHDATVSPPNALVESIARAGYGADVVSTEDSSVKSPRPKGLSSHESAAGQSSSGATVDRCVLHVEGMRCISCSNNVEGILRAIPGVKAALVDLLSARAAIDYEVTETARVGPRDFIEAINEGGYIATIAPDNGKDDRSRQILERDERSFLHLFLWSLLFTVPVFAIEMVILQIKGSAARRELDSTAVWTLSLAEFLKWLLTTPVQWVVGWRFHRGAYNALKRGMANMDVLVSLGTSAAYIYSTIVTILSMVQRARSPLGPQEAVRVDYRTDHMTATFWETSGMLISFILLGKFLEAKAKSRTSDALSSLFQLCPPEAILVTIDQDTQGITSEKTVETALIHRGDVLRVLPGARVPVDGVVLQGVSSVDESMVTGESRPVRKAPGDEVIGGTQNLAQGALLVRATHVGADSAIAQIAKLVQDAQLNRAPIQALADKISAKFVPLVILVGVTTFLAWLIAGETHAYPSSWLPRGYNRFIFALLFGISVVVVACPCALGLGTPTAVMVGAGIAAKNGILFRGGEPLEALSKVDAVVFDKTGTLTMGSPEVVGVLKAPAAATTGPDALLLRLLLTAELSSEHHLAKAVVRFCSAKLAEAQERRQPPSLVATGNSLLGRRPSNAGSYSDTEIERPALLLLAGKRSMSAAAHALPMRSFEVLPGMGVRAEIENPETRFVHRVLIGSRDIARFHGIGMTERVDSWMRGEEVKARSCVVLVVDGILVASLSIADALKPEAKAVVAALQRRGLQVHLLTGDNGLTAHAVASELGVPPEFVKAQVTPAGKIAEIERLQGTLNRNGRPLRVAMIGDGVNDSASLVKADVGIGIGSGTEVATNSSDVILMRSDLEDVLIAMDISRVTLRRILINYFGALTYNVLLIPFAAGILFPAIRYQLPPWLAGVAMASSSVSVVLSSLSLKLYRRPAPLMHSAGMVVTSHEPSVHGK